jgi:monoamine oxidase
VTAYSGARAVVIGGSIGGLTAALLLRGLGFAVEVYERSAAPLSGRSTSTATAGSITEKNEPTSTRHGERSTAHYWPIWAPTITTSASTGADSARRHRR